MKRIIALTLMCSAVPLAFASTSDPVVPESGGCITFAKARASAPKELCVRINTQGIEEALLPVMSEAFDLLRGIIEKPSSFDPKTTPTLPTLDQLISTMESMIGVFDGAPTRANLGTATVSCSDTRKTTESELVKHTRIRDDFVKHVGIVHTMASSLSGVIARDNKLITETSKLLEGTLTDVIRTSTDKKLEQLHANVKEHEKMLAEATLLVHALYPANIPGKPKTAGFTDIVASYLPWGQSPEAPDPVDTIAFPDGKETVFREFFNGMLKKKSSWVLEQACKGDKPRLSYPAATPTP